MSDPELYARLTEAAKLLQQDRRDDVERLLRSLLAADSDNPYVLQLNGILAMKQNRLPEAEDFFRRAIAVKSDFVEAHNNLGIVLRSAGRFSDSVDAYKKALELRPADPDILNNLGMALQGLGKFDESIAALRKAVELRPDHSAAYGNLGIVLRAADKPEEAIQALARAIELSPGFADAYCNYANAARDLGRLDEAVAMYRKAIQIRPDPGTHSNLVFTINFHPAYDPQTILRGNREWDRLYGQPLKETIRPHENDARPDRKLRIGYVSPDFRDHCQSLFTGALFSKHNRSAFEIFCYSAVTHEDSITQGLRGQADHWQNIVGLTHGEIAEKIRDDKIDILVDLTMHMAQNRLPVFARKPAPVQVSWLAYPGTTGVEAIDYRITDPHLDPPGEHDSWYSEKSIRLPDTFWCYDPLTDHPEPNALPALKNGFITFGCLNNFCKVTDQSLSPWSRILKSLPTSRLILLAPPGEHRRRIYAGLGVDSDRVEFAQFQPREKYLGTYHRIDLCLDTFPVNGHTTSLDALWMGVPVMSMVGHAAIARAGISQNTNLGLAAELVGRTGDEFVSLTLKLAANLDRLSELRKTLRARMSASALMDAPKFAKNMEAAYRQMWITWCRSRGA
ncbi:MAG: tetratricopeptide repeat protein [Tepidisphaeraceae bacterium]|jgi:predicted O-linked N-acetylglucosamine transferase (SPINDLY family)